MGVGYIQSFRIFEQLENIAVNIEVDAGDLISVDQCKKLVTAELVRKNYRGKYVLTLYGLTLWNSWRRVYENAQA